MNPSRHQQSLDPPDLEKAGCRLETLLRQSAVALDKHDDNREVLGRAVFIEHTGQTGPNSKERIH